MEPEDNISEDREKNVESAMITLSKEEIIKDKEQKAILTEDHCGEASSCLSCRYRKTWYLVELLKVIQRDEQRALLLDVLKRDKSEVHSVYYFRDLISFYAFMTKEEADKLTKLEEVELVEVADPKWIRREKDKSRRKIYTVPKVKKRKLSTGHILSERRKNREKWRYDEDMELKSKEINESEEESEEESEDYCSSDSSGSSKEFYLSFDESGRRWYKVSLVNDKRPEEHLALLQATLNLDESEISYRCAGADHLFEAYMTEEEADKVAGLEEVEFVEPHRIAVFTMD